MFLHYDESSSKSPWRPRHPFVACNDLFAALVCVGGFLLLDGWGRLYCAVLVLMFVASMLYHWHRDQILLHRIDRAVIFILIGGTVLPYVPQILELGKVGILRGLVLVVLCGTVATLLGYNKGRGRQATVLYIGTGLGSVWCMLGVQQFFGLAWAVFFWFGVALYVVQLVIYNQKWPNPRPDEFGFAEIQHLVLMLAGPVIHLTLTFVYTT